MPRLGNPRRSFGALLIIWALLSGTAFAWEEEPFSKSGGFEQQLPGLTPVTKGEERAFERAHTRRMRARAGLEASAVDRRVQATPREALPARPDAYRREIGPTRGLAPLPITHFFP